MSLLFGIIKEPFLLCFPLAFIVGLGLLLVGSDEQRHRTEAVLHSGQVHVADALQHAVGDVGHLVLVAQAGQLDADAPRRDVRRPAAVVVVLLWLLLLLLLFFQLT